MKLFGQRHSIRLKKYDYPNEGWYFVTICTQNRECLFGQINDEKMILNNIGNLINKLWNEIQERFNFVELDTFQIMPNHLHGIIVIVGAGLVPALKQKIPIHNLISINGKRATTRVAPYNWRYYLAFKPETTHEYIVNVKNNNWPKFDKRLWQRNYYEHIIRNEFELNRIRQYIRDNPANWDENKNNLKSEGGDLIKWTQTQNQRQNQN